MPPRRRRTIPTPRWPAWLPPACLIVSLLAGLATADDDYRDELPRIPPREPQAALASFSTAPGYQVRLAAAEPLVVDPVALAFDENGRLFVVEMRGYSEQADDRLGRVRLLEDLDDDGRFDRASVYLDGLAWPTAVFPYDGGVFIGAAPDILYAKDTDGDGQADLRRTVFTGFGRGNVQGLLNSFQWGLDNRIHGATSSAGGSVRPADAPHADPIELGGRDFAFDPRTLKLAPTSGGAQHGLGFDAWGRKFVSSNSDHIQQVMYDDHYLARNPRLIAPGARVSIAVDGPQAEVFRASPVEPWRVVRTRLRVAGAVPGPIEGGGRAAGYFTGASGVTIHTGDAWQDDDYSLAVVGDVGGNIVHRKRLDPNGVGFLARRIDEQSEFVASSDIWFRPAQFANAPDGALYIADVYREVIEHPDSLPPAIKRHLDLTSGRDRGRIYRIEPERYERRPAPRLGQATTRELVATLAHPNGWHRLTAARLLHERQDPAAVEPLKKLAASSPAPLGRMHALYSLAGLDALRPEVMLQALDDPHPRVREHAVRLAEHVAQDSAEVRRRLIAMVADDDLGVRWQLAFSLGELDDADRLAALAELARHDGHDRWARLAILSSLGDDVGGVFTLLMDDASFRASPTGRTFLEELARQITTGGVEAELTTLGEALDRLSPGDDAAAVIVRGASAGRRGPLPPGLEARLKEALKQAIVDARRVVAGNEHAEPARVEAIRTLGLGSFDTVREALAARLDEHESSAVQRATLQALARFAAPDVGDVLVDAWPRLSPALRAEAAEALTARPERITSLLDAVEQGVIAPVEIDPARRRRLSEHHDPALRSRAAQLFADSRLARRPEVIEAYHPALELPGDAERGQAAFSKVCASCHRVGGVGHEIGPNLLAMRNRGAEAILLAVLDPNREVDPRFINYTLLTVDGRALTGVVAAETSTSVTLERAEQVRETVARSDIERLASSGLSIMPEGLEQQLDRQTMADLIAFLTSAE